MQRRDMLKLSAVVASAPLYAIRPSSREVVQIDLASSGWSIPVYRDEIPWDLEIDWLRCEQRTDPVPGPIRFSLCVKGGKPMVFETNEDGIVALRGR